MADMLKSDRSVAVISEGYEDVQLTEDVRQLRGFAALTPDWNSYGAKPIAPAAIAAAELLLTQVARAFGIRPDIIAPLATGGVHLEWSGGEAEIEVRVNPNGTYSYVFMREGTFSEMHRATANQAIG